MNHNWHTKIRRLVPVSFWINRPPDGHFMLPKCYAQWASKFGKLSSGHKTGKDPFSFQSQRRAMPKNVQTTIQLPSFHIGLPWCLSGKESACNAGDLGSIPGSQRSPGEGNGNPLQYSCLENPESDMTERLHFLSFTLYFIWIQSYLCGPHHLCKAWQL